MTSAHLGKLRDRAIHWIEPLLVPLVRARFIANGVTTMTLMADTANPSCAFYEAIGGEVQREARGRPQRGAYIWRDLPKLAAICPMEAVASSEVMLSGRGAPGRR